MIRSEADLEKALTYLADTDDDYAIAKGNVLGYDNLAKRVHARIFLTSAGSVAERNAKAECHPDTVKAVSEHHEAIVVFEKIKARRETQERNIEIWRSLEATRRRVLA